MARPERCSRIGAPLRAVSTPVAVARPPAACGLGLRGIELRE
ncbi:hypothetical protein ACIGNX_02920 [Actinosynnema sp. NPDC053489]